MAAFCCIKFVSLDGIVDDADDGLTVDDESDRDACPRESVDHVRRAVDGIDVPIGLTRFLGFVDSAFFAEESEIWRMFGEEIDEDLFVFGVDLSEERFVVFDFDVSRDNPKFFEISRS